LHYKIGHSYKNFKYLTTRMVETSFDPAVNLSEMAANLENQPCPQKMGEAEVG
jgi:hypothetical protein